MGADILTLRGYCLLQFGDACLSAATTLFTGCDLLINLLLKHLDTTIDASKFKVYFLLLTAEWLNILFNTGDGFIYQDAVGEAVDNLFLLLIRRGQEILIAILR